MDIFQATKRSPWRTFASANLTTTNAAPTLADIATIPATAKECPSAGHGSAYGPTLIQFLPYGVGAAGNTFTARIVGYSPKFDGSGYIEHVIATVTPRLVAVTFISPNTTQKTCDQIAIGYGEVDKDIRVLEYTGGWSTAIVDLRGSDYFDIHVDKGTATSANFLYREW